MKQSIIKSIILGIIGLVALGWGISYGVSGLAWFPGFFVAVVCFIKILDVNNVGKEAGR
jgi:hypothetical protein